MGNTTHIEIYTETRRRLRVWKAKRDLTYDEAISQLLEEHDAES